MYDYGRCEICDTLLEENNIKQDFWIKGRLVVVENVPAGICPQCGEKVVNAHYAIVDLPLLSRLRFIGGVRYERTDMQLISLDETKDDGQISTEDWLPSINFIYNVKDDMNLRLSATRTRPTSLRRAGQRPHASALPSAHNLLKSLQA